ncbi:hypothetical protein K439DRAFT_1611749 [Ramaria rubella]|nr:hypothetical protein K439DRAFT_1611749 [Ramaria rubella]
MNMSIQLYTQVPAGVGSVGQNPQATSHDLGIQVDDLNKIEWVPLSSIIAQSKLDHFRIQVDNLDEIKPAFLHHPSNKDSFGRPQETTTDADGIHSGARHVASSQLAVHESELCRNQEQLDYTTGHGDDKDLGAKNTGIRLGSRSHSRPSNKLFNLASDQHLVALKPMTHLVTPDSLEQLVPVAATMRYWC